jgi:hypothetical protein
MATKKTAKKSSNVGQAKAAQKKIAQAATTDAGPKYGSLQAFMVGAAKTGLPRGAKFAIVGGRVRCGVGMQTLLDVSVDEVARWGLRKGGFKVEHAA